MTATTEHTDTASLSETEQRNLRAVSDVLAFWNTANIPGILSFYDEGITWRNVALEETYQGKEAVEGFLERLYTAFPDLNFTVTNKIARGDAVAEQWLIRGTHRGPFLGVPATNRPVEIPGMSMVQMRDGKFARDEFYFDAAIVMRQMQLLPPLSVAETLPGRAGLWLIVNRSLVLQALVAIVGARLLFGLLRRARG
jgi:steroid delta-isomerase-like uncharacterized protein